MTALYLILLLAAALCFFVDAFTTSNPTRVKLLQAGLFFWVLVPLIQTARNLN